MNLKVCDHNTECRRPTTLCGILLYFVVESFLLLPAQRNNKLGSFNGYLPAPPKKGNNKCCTFTKMIDLLEDIIQNRFMKKLRVSRRDVNGIEEVDKLFFPKDGLETPRDWKYLNDGRRLLN